MNTGVDHLGRPIVTYHSTDLEAIVTLLTLAAIYLTPSPGTRFTFDQLIAQARDIGGDDIVLDETDARIVISTSHLLIKKDGTYSLR